MAAPTMRLCGTNQSGELVKAVEIQRARINLGMPGSCWDAGGLAATADRVVRTADGILEAVVVPNRKPKDLGGKEIEPWIVKKELETVCGDLLFIVDALNRDFKDQIPQDGIVNVHERKIDLHRLASVMHLQITSIAFHANEYAKSYSQI